MYHRCIKFNMFQICKRTALLTSNQIKRDFCSSKNTLVKKMPSNVEIKANVADPARFRSLALQASGEKKVDVLQQEDTFFKCQSGRLKLRETINRPDAASQLISYERSDVEGPKKSKYSITFIKDAESLKTTLGMALGVRGVVKKTRTLIMIGQTRVHIDEVEGLGNFMELEVVLRDGQTQEEGVAIAETLMRKLSVHPSDLISGAYMDLLES